MIDIVSLYSELSTLSNAEQQQRLLQLKDNYPEQVKDLQKMLLVDDIPVSGTEFVSQQLSISTTTQWQDFVGQEVMGFTIKDILSESGGMGFVFHAEQKIFSPNNTHNEIHKSAIKILRTDKLDTEQQKTMFFSEASSLMSLDHPNICSIYGVSEVLGHACIVMDYIDGQRLDTWLALNKDNDKQKLNIFLQLLNAISYLHDLKVYHGDLKPQNIIINDLGHLIVIDLGLARKFELHETNKDSKAVQAFSRNWSAPEQVAGEQHKAPSDVYSLGAVLCYLLTDNPPKSCTEGNINDKELWALIKKSLAVEAADRYLDANEFLLAVKRYQAGFAVKEYSSGPLYQFKKLLKRNPITSLACFLMVYSIASSVMLLAR